MTHPTYHASYTGAQVEAAIAEALPLENFTHISDEIIDGKQFHVLWKVTPTLTNAVSGISIHPENGQLCEVISAAGSSSATSVKTYAPSPVVEDDTLILTY
jgi:hypothetical protein